MPFDLFGFPKDVIACHLSYSRSRTTQSAKHTHRSRLTCSIGSKKTENFSPLHLKRDMIDCRKMSEGFGQLLHLDNRSCHLLRLLPFQGWRTKNGSKLLKNPFGRIDSVHLPVINKSNPVALTSLIHNRSGNNDRNPLFSQITEHLPKFFPRHRIYTRSRFIQK